MIPSAEWVRFTMSGTEATMLAMRDARAFTGRDKIIRFAGPLPRLARLRHGWLPAAVRYPDVDWRPEGRRRNRCWCAYPNNIDSVRELLDAHADQVAAVILEPGGGSNGIIPDRRGSSCARCATLTRERGVVLIFDEVITGFRYSPGGAQQLYGVTPDVTTLAKIVAGGLPGGAVVGKRDVLDVQTFKGELHKDRFERVLQQGTFNANPLSAAAGLAALQIVAEGLGDREVRCRPASSFAQGLRDVMETRGVAGAVLGSLLGVSDLARRRHGGSGRRRPTCSG